MVLNRVTWFLVPIFLHSIEIIEVSRSLIPPRYYSYNLNLVLSSLLCPVLPCADLALRHWGIIMSPVIPNTNGSISLKNPYNAKNYSVGVL